MMGALSNTVHQRIERFLEKLMTLVELSQAEWGDTVIYFHERDTKYSTSELRIPVVAIPQTVQEVSAPPHTTYAELMEYVDNVPGTTQIMQRTSRPGSSHMREGFGKPQLDTGILGLAPAAGWIHHLCR
jgi:hypothetical protein